MSVYVLNLPDEQAEFRPDPFPGSTEARLLGCTCPKEQPWPGKLAFDLSCPVHELEFVH